MLYANHMQGKSCGNATKYAVEKAADLSIALKIQYCA
jgi:hypothetical protein